MLPLDGHKALVVGIANEHSIAWGCAKALKAQGAALAVTWLNDKARSYVEPLARELGADIMGPLDVSQADQIETLFKKITGRWGGLDTLLHSIAFAPRADQEPPIAACCVSSVACAREIVEVETREIRPRAANRTCFVMGWIRLIEEAESSRCENAACSKIDQIEGGPRCALARLRFRWRPGVSLNCYEGQ